MSKNQEELKEKILKKLENVVDPEIGIDIVNLGLIHEIKFIDDKNVKIKMILTTPYCPLADTILNQVKENLSSIEEIDNINIELINEPWTPDRMSKKAKKKLGIL